LPEKTPQEDERPLHRGFWTGTISFGLVSIPVSLFPATRPNRFSLRTLGPKGSPLARRYVASDTGQPLSEEETVRGFELEGGEHLVVTDEELDRLAPAKSRDIDLRLFTARHAICPAYFERPYFLVPSGPSAKAYRLLAQTMEKLERTGIATFVMRGKEYLVAIFAENNILLAVTLRWADEIRSPADVGLGEVERASAASVRALKKFIEAHSAEEIPREELRDRRIEALQKLVEKKYARKDDVITTPEEEVSKGQVVDIFELLKQTLARTNEEARGRQEERREEQPAKKAGSAAGSPRKRSARSRKAA
jgi:DNA end-binding protein Ku